MPRYLETIFERLEWQHSVKTAIAAGLCLWLTQLLGLQQGYWAAITAVVVMQSETAATLVASRDRLLGTAIGALLGWAGGWAATRAGHVHMLIYTATILLCLVVPAAFGFQGAGRLAGVAATIIMAVPSLRPRAIVARDRFLEVGFGIVVALAISHGEAIAPRRRASR